MGQILSFFYCMVFNIWLNLVFFWVVCFVFDLRQLTYPTSVVLLAHETLEDNPSTNFTLSLTCSFIMHCNDHMVAFTVITVPVVSQDKTNYTWNFKLDRLLY